MPPIENEELDRGDDVIPPSTIDDTPDDAEQDEAVVAEAAEAAAAEELAERAAESAEEKKPRDESGKFTKKNREVPDHVPKARMDEAVTRERTAREAAERRAADLEQMVRQEERSASTAVMEEKIEELEGNYTRLLLDGEKEKAAAVMKQIRQANSAMADAKADEKVAYATNAAVEQVRMEAAIASLEAQYPTFNPDSNEFDQDLVDLVLAEQARLLRTTNTVPSKALIVSANKIMTKFAPVAIDEGVAKGLSAAKVNAGRKAEQVAKNLDASKRQPASTKVTGKDSDKGGESDITVAGMTMAEFTALPESTKSKLRGDTL